MITYNRLKLLLVALSFATQATTQITGPPAYRITYELTYKKFKNSDTRYSENMLLLVSGNRVQFVSESKYRIDSIFETTNVKTAGFANLMKNMPETNFDFFILHSLGSDKVFYYQKILKDRFYYEEPIEFNWKIYQDSKQILGYTCQKATTGYQGRSYTAWFAYDIPLATGPYKFFGLPGLILEIYDDRKEYRFLAKGISAPENLYIREPGKRKFTRLSKKTFNETLRKLNENPLKVIEQSGITVEFADDRQKQALIRAHQEQIKNRNPIELTGENE